jgi:hypothetical protein
MGFLDKVKDTANKAAEQVQKAAETGQDKLEESKLKKKIGDLKEELGGVVYGQRTGAIPAGDEEINAARQPDRRAGRPEHLTPVGCGC